MARARVDDEPWAPSVGIDLYLPSECKGECFCLNQDGINAFAANIEDNSVCQERVKFLLEAKDPRKDDFQNRFVAGIVGFSAAFILIYFTSK